MMIDYSAGNVFPKFLTSAWSTQIGDEEEKEEKGEEEVEEEQGEEEEGEEEEMEAEEEAE